MQKVKKEVQEMSKLLFCENPDYYKKIDKSLLWSYFITDSWAECKKYISLYMPKSITISENMAENIDELINHVKKEYKDFPSIFIFSKERILSSITDEFGKRQILHADKIPLETDKIINNIMLKYSFVPKLKGYTYIKRAMYEGLLNDGAYINIKKILYPNIATMYLVSEGAVERGITFSILKAYEKSEEMKELFQNSSRPPSNLEFLKRFFIVVKDDLSCYTHK